MKKFVEYLFFLRIVISPLVVGIFIGFLFFLYFEKEKTGIFLFEIFSILGFVVGILWAIHISKKQKPSDFISKTNASPDIDEAVKEKKKSEEFSSDFLYH